MNILKAAINVANRRRSKHQRPETASRLQQQFIALNAATQGAIGRAFRAFPGKLQRKERGFVQIPKTLTLAEVEAALQRLHNGSSDV